MDRILDPPTSDLITASRNLRASSRDLRVHVAEIREQAKAAVARARQLQLTTVNNGIRRIALTAEDDH